MVFSIMFLIYVLVHNMINRRSHIKGKSHGSAFIRQGAFVFGSGALSIAAMALATLLFNENAGTLRIVNAALSLTFVFLQMLVIILCPRLNLVSGFGIPHFGFMHLLSTNIVIWVEMLIQEYQHTIHEMKHHEDHPPRGLYNTTEIDDVFHNQEDIEEFFSQYFQFDSSSILIAFTIEFALIGATVFYNKWNNVESSYGFHSWELGKKQARLERPNLKAFVSSIDWSNSSYGAGLGLVIVLLNISTLFLFDEDGIHQYASKVTRSVTNLFGIIVAIPAILKIQKLPNKTEIEETGMDRFLLILGGTFCYLYMSATVPVGVIMVNDKVPGTLHIMNGIFDILQVTIQIVFITTLLKKVIRSKEDNHPGRQATAFLVLMNLSLWLMSTFQLDEASYEESDFYGGYTWAMIQVFTLPLVIFFRFHSTLLLLDCWKNSYKVQSEHNSNDEIKIGKEDKVVDV